MAEVVGAAFAHMDQATLTPSVPTLYEGTVHALPVPFKGRHVN